MASEFSILRNCVVGSGISNCVHGPQRSLYSHTAEAKDSHPALVRNITVRKVSLPAGLHASRLIGILLLMSLRPGLSEVLGLSHA